MIGFAEGFSVWTVSTLVPALLGLVATTLVGKRVAGAYISAFAFGIFLLFFVDTIGGAANLDVNSGFGGGLAQLGVVLFFLVGTLFFFWVDRGRTIFSPQISIGKYGMAIPLIVALAIGIHGLGEGAAFGGTAQSTTSTDLLEAFGGLSAGIAYVLHKGLEPMMIGACYSVYVKGQFKKARSWIKEVGLLGIIFTIPSLIGAATGYFIGYDTTYFFALGTGACIYAAIRLVGPFFDNPEGTRSNQAVKLAACILMGFITIYFAALFHSD